MTTVDPTLQNPPPGFVPSAASAVAFEQLKDEISVAAGTITPPINVDLAQAVRVMLTVSGNVQRFASELASLGMGADLPQRLAKQAEALSYAHAMYAWSLDGPAPIEGLAEEVMVARRVLTNQLELLQLRGVMGRNAIALQGTTSYVAMAHDVRAIGSAFIANWSRVSPEIGDNIQRVNDAIELADKLLAIVAEAQELKEKAKDAAAMRAGAWTLALKTYRAIDRGISFLRYEQGDAAEIVPSLFDKARRRRPEGEEPGAPESPVVAPASPASPAGASPAAPAQPNTPATPVAPTTPFQ